MIKRIEHRLERIRRKHAGSRILLVCDNRDLCAKLSAALTTSENFQPLFIDFCDQVVYRAETSIACESGNSTSFSLLISQDQGFSHARKCANSFKARFQDLFVDRQNAADYKLYGDVIDNWVFHQGLFRAVSLLSCALNRFNTDPSQVSVFLLNNDWRSIAIDLCDGRVTYFFPTPTASDTSPKTALRPTTATRKPQASWHDIGRQTWRTVKKVLSATKRSAATILRKSSAEVGDSQKPLPAQALSRMLRCCHRENGRGFSASCLMVFNANSKTHLATILPIMTELVSSGFENSFEVLSISNTHGKTASHLASESLSAEVFDWNALKLGSALKSASRELELSAADLFRKALPLGGLTDEELKCELPDYILHALLKKLFRIDLPRLVIVAGMLRERFSSSKPVVAVTCIDSHWIGEFVRSLSQGTGRPVVCIQNAYMSASPRYRVPKSDTITVIDHWTRELMLNHFDCPPETVKVTGTPRFDPLAKLAGRSNAKRQGQLSETTNPGRPTILFAAQPENLTVSTDIILDSLANVHCAASIVIKLHPYSSQEFAEQLRLHAGTLETPHTVTIHQHANIHDLLADCNVLVTVSSNVGVEAAIAGKDIVVAKLQTIENELPLDKFDIGLVARSRTELTSTVESILEDSNVRNLLHEKRLRYAELNPRLFAGDSRKVISKLIAEAYNGDHPSNRPLEAPDRSAKHPKSA